jgi:hypothetical protein
VAKFRKALLTSSARIYSSNRLGSFLEPRKQGLAADGFFGINPASALQTASLRFTAQTLVVKVTESSNLPTADLELAGASGSWLVTEDADLPAAELLLTGYALEVYVGPQAGILDLLSLTQGFFAPIAPIESDLPTGALELAGHAIAVEISGEELPEPPPVIPAGGGGGAPRSRRSRRAVRLPAKADPIICSLVTGHAYFVGNPLTAIVTENINSKLRSAEISIGAGQLAVHVSHHVRSDLPVFHISTRGIAPVIVTTNRISEEEALWLLMS